MLLISLSRDFYLVEMLPIMSGQVTSVLDSHEFVFQTTTEKDNKGKEACTKFQRLSTDGLHSIVRCEPVTGRTHQVITGTNH